MARNPEVVRAVKARYRARHREELRAKGRAYDTARRADPKQRAKEAAAAKERLANDPERHREITLRSYTKHAEERRAAARAARASNPERVREYNQRWREANPEKAQAHAALRRARVKGSPEAVLIDRSVIYKRDGGRCHICGLRVSGARFHIDHLVPLSHGGSHTPENVALAHPKCNLRRHDGRLPAQLLLVGI